MMKKTLFLTLAVLQVLSLCAAESSDISKGWQFRQQGLGEWLPAEVPGTVHTDLLANKVIPEPFYGTHQKDLQWIDKVNWEYRCRFDAPQAAGRQNARLVFEGVDCFAEISLNGTPIATTENMFRTWTCDVKGILKKQNNELVVIMKSPTMQGLANMTEYGVHLRANNDLSILGGMGPNKVSVYTRKAGYQYGWDLTPRYVTSGIWRPVRLESWNDAKVEDLYVYTQSAEKKNAVLGISLTTVLDAAGRYTVRYLVNGQPAKSSEQNFGKGENVIEESLTIRSPRLWYPQGLGEPYLYDIEAILEKDGRAIDRKSVRTGIRTTRLQYHPDADGRCFFLEINGQPVFCKGSNWVPGDSFLPRFSREQLEHAVNGAAEANMNILRVWGGGVYEDDYFYELCDRLGIMVWQDFVFACNMYPGGPKYYDSIRAEAEDNVRRLRNHPSVVIWCGNNEIDVAWKPFNKPESRFRKFYTPEQATQFDKVNETIFRKILPDAVAGAYKQEMPYWHSTPSPGWGLDTLDRWKNGDVHNWDVWHKGVPISDYNKLIARFSTEYGLQSFPEVSSIRKYTPEKELYIGSPTLRSHQGDVKGDKRILQYIDELYRRTDDFAHTVYLSQLMQAEGIRTAVEAHRRNRPYCMGTIIWQHNDTWPCTSWAGVDYYGRWKAMNYYMRKAFEPVIVAPYLHGDSLDVFVVSDLTSRLKGSLEMTLMDFSGKTIHTERLPLTVEGGSSKPVARLSASDCLRGSDPREVMLVCRLKSDKASYTAVQYFEPMKNITLPRPDIRISVSAGPEGICAVTVRTDVLAKNLTVYYDGVAGIFSDNYFDLLPGESRTITVPTDETPEKVAEKLTYVSL